MALEFAILRCYGVAARIRGDPHREVFAIYPLESKLVQGAEQIQEFAGGCQLVRANDNLRRYMTLAAALARREGATGAEIRGFVESFGDNPGADMQEFFVLLRPLEKPAAEELGPGAGG